MQKLKWKQKQKRFLVVRCLKKKKKADKISGRAGENFLGEHFTGATINVMCVISGLYFRLISVHDSSLMSVIKHPPCEHIVQSNPCLSGFTQFTCTCQSLMGWENIWVKWFCVESCSGASGLIKEAASLRLILLSRIKWCHGSGVDSCCSWISRCRLMSLSDQGFTPDCGSFVAANLSSSATGYLFSWPNIFTTDNQQDYSVH